MKLIAPKQEHVSYQRQMRTCGKCKRCLEGGAHGPYWYAYWRDYDTGKVKSAYVGKHLPISALPSEEGQSTSQPTDTAATLPPTPRRRRRRKQDAFEVTSPGYCPPPLTIPLAALPA